MHSLRQYAIQRLDDLTTPPHPRPAPHSPPPQYPMSASNFYISFKISFLINKLHFLSIEHFVILVTFYVIIILLFVLMTREALWSPGTAPELMSGDTFKVLPRGRFVLPPHIVPPRPPSVPPSPTPAHASMQFT